MDTKSNLPQNLLPLVKTIGNHDRGMAALLSGENKPFSSFPETLKQRYNVSLFPDMRSLELLESLVQQILVKAINGNGLSLYTAGDDYPFHVTLLEGTSDSQQDLSLSDFAPKGYYQTSGMNADVVGTEVAFSELVVDGSNITLHAVNIPEIVIKSRRLLGDRYRQEGFTALPMTDIFHMTLGRITSEMGAQARLNYAVEMLNLRRVIREKPIIVNIGSHYEGASWHLVRGH